MDKLHAHWISTWADCALAPPPGLLERLLAAWREPQRHYHTLQHLEECLALFDALREEARRPAELALALWFHDAVYDVRAHDNEARSAQWAVQALQAAGLARESCARVEALIMATCHGAAPPPDLASPAAADIALLTDIDLAILGAPTARFAEYERQIRAEYAWVAPAVYLVKRRAVLQGFLARPQLYATPLLHARLERQARHNLTNAIDNY